MPALHCLVAESLSIPTIGGRVVRKTWEEIMSSKLSLQLNLENLVGTYANPGYIMCR